MYEVASSIDVVLSAMKTKRGSSEKTYYVVAIQRDCPDKVAKLVEFCGCLSVYPGISIRAVMKGHREKDKLMHMASSWQKLLGKRIDLSDMSEVRIVGDDEFDHSRRMVHLIGDSGSGKTTIFNALTGADERVTQSSTGTFGCAIGVRRDGGNDYNIIDTPGVRDSNGLDSSNSQAIAGFVSKAPYVALVIIVIDASARNPSNWAPFKEYYKEQFPPSVRKQIVFTTEAGNEADMEGFLEEHEYGLDSVFSPEELQSALIISRSRARAGLVPKHVLTAMLSKASDNNTMTLTAQRFYDRFERLYRNELATRDAAILAAKRATFAILDDVREDMGSKALHISPLGDQKENNKSVAVNWVRKARPKDHVKRSWRVMLTAAVVRPTTIYQLLIPHDWWSEIRISTIRCDPPSWYNFDHRASKKLGWYSVDGDELIAKLKESDRPTLIVQYQRTTRDYAALGKSLGWGTPPPAIDTAKMIESVTQPCEDGETEIPRDVMNNLVKTRPI
ncbi:unnamed protein product [Chondrus crispus]|uniref:G domain-containing protein n=1 Tax=Chondrus crispus TaxID=2769 RepID=R7QGL4_CHOCR|nr:unnamed protein product [Chondrus crispus]CDF36898.1 unnamed protein product [Chondrus crispus]|eukprot:XP_005716717.1 unnamed protein product [Chondrus crispus]